MARRILSLSQLRETLQNITPQSRDNIVQSLRNCALMVERDAKINAPVDTGTLRNSISHRIDEDNLTAEIGASVFYGKFQEYGTGQRGASSGLITPSDYEYGSSRGIPAHPFLGPALLSNRVRIQRMISNAIRSALQGR